MFLCKYAVSDEDGLKAEHIAASELINAIKNLGPVSNREDQEETGLSP